MPAKRRPSNDSGEQSQADGWEALSDVADLFRQAGWSVEEQAPVDADRGADLMVRQGPAAYSIELKASSEGRADRLVPLWAQAYLQAKRAAPKGWQPLAIVAAPSISDGVLRQIRNFAQQNVPGAALGIIDRHGRRHFEGDALTALNKQPERTPKHARATVRRGNLFTDINQWLLKVLLAPWLPANLTAAPRGDYRNVTELARAANVSVMSAFRLVDALRADGHMDERAGTLRVVRRGDLLERWRAWTASQTPREVPGLFIISGDPRAELRSVLTQKHVGVALALFAAADALGLGFVRGVVPYVYLTGLTPVAIGHLSNVELAKVSEHPDLYLREAPARQSVFRAAVKTPHGLVTDVLQTWLDVSSHPARGREQADVIERRVLAAMMEDE